MSIETGLRDYLVADSGVTAIVGTKVYPQEAADDVAEPYVTYRLADSDEPRYLNGTVRYRKFTYEVTCYTKVYDDATALAEAVRAAIGGTGGANSVSTTLDGNAVIMFWEDTPRRRSGTSALDNPRSQVAMNLTILQK